MAYLGIGEKQLEQIDNKQNRNIVIDNIVNNYISDTPKFYNKESEIIVKILGVLRMELKKFKLYQLLVLTEEDADTIIWNSIFEDIKADVCEQIFGAKGFFEKGSYAQLQSDEFWDEYNIVIDMLPKDAYNFMLLKYNKSQWNDKVKEVCEYVKNVASCKCKWVAFSHDGAYENFSRKSFDDKKDCYNDMRNAVLEKMKWNTEYDEDFPESDTAIGYKVLFKQDMIIHTSYSGAYVYKIVGADDVVKIEDIFTEEFKEWLKVMDLRYIS